MLLKYLPGLLFNPSRAWQRINNDTPTTPSTATLYLSFIIILALIFPLCGYYATTQLGWNANTGETVRLTSASGLRISALLLLSLLIGVYVLGLLIRWMSDTYGFKRDMNRCLLLAAGVSAPIFLSGAFMLFSEIWIVYIAALIAIFMSVRILYSGVPIILDLPSTKGFLLSSAILCVGLVVIVAILAASAILWGHGVDTSFVK